MSSKTHFNNMFLVVLITKNRGFTVRFYVLSEVLLRYVILYLSQFMWTINLEFCTNCFQKSLHFFNTTLIYINNEFAIFSFITYWCIQLPYYKVKFLSNLYAIFHLLIANKVLGLSKCLKWVLLSFNCVFSKHLDSVKWWFRL